MSRRASAAAAPEVAALIGPVLGLSDEEMAAQVEAYRASVDHERASAQLPETALAASIGA